MLSLFVICAVISALIQQAGCAEVTVGPDLAFHPTTVFGNPGELVNFHFAGSGFSVSEATARLSDPCNTQGGFDSGVQGNGGTFSIVISTHNSIYVFSSPQCRQGMVMIINPGPNDSIRHYAQIASGGSSSGNGAGAASSSRQSQSQSNSLSSSTVVQSAIPQTTSASESNGISSSGSMSSVSSTSALSSSGNGDSLTSPMSSPASATTPPTTNGNGASSSVVEEYALPILLILSSFFVLQLL